MKKSLDVFNSFYFEKGGIFMALTGTFKLDKFKRDTADYFRNPTSEPGYLPDIIYTAGKGETLQSVFDGLVTWKGFNRDKCVRDGFYKCEGNKAYGIDEDLDGKDVTVEVALLNRSEALNQPNFRDVKSTIETLNKKSEQLSKRTDAGLETVYALSHSRGKVMFKGKFDLKRFENDYTKVLRSSKPTIDQYMMGDGNFAPTNMFYCAGRAETLESLWYKLTGHDTNFGSYDDFCSDNSSLKESTNLQGKTVLIWVEYLRKSKYLPSAVQKAIAECDKAFDDAFYAHFHKHSVLSELKARQHRDT